MYTNSEAFIESVATPLGWFYVMVAAMNVVAACRALRGRRRLRGRRWLRAALWLAIAVGFGGLGGQALAGRPLLMPESVKAALDGLLGPMTCTLGTFGGLVVLYLGRRWFVIPAVAWMMLDGSLLLVGLSITDPQFAAIVTKPDNVPIVAMVYLLAFFTWLAAAQAAENDRRLAEDLPPKEKQHDGKVLVWPDLVYIELICMILVTVLLVVWSIALRAPLEQPANPVVTPNPSKAPWYFLGLQEMLVFSDAWNVGVMVPCLILFGLMAIPYLDFNPQGNGYYTIRQRRFAYKTFQFGFLQLWVLLILIGTFMRGPNWSFFGPYEVRDPHKVVALTNVKLSEYFWVMLLGRGVPHVPVEGGALARWGHVLWRELPGVAFVAVYFVALPPLLGRTLLRSLRRQMGLGRYTLTVVLLLLMLTLPLKMILRWTMNVSYIVSMPEYFFNF